MSEITTEPMTANRMAKELGASEAKVKSAITRLALEPCATKGCCRYYSAQALQRIREALQG